jgi:precorrin-6B methylase 2
MTGGELIDAYHREERDADDDALDAALGIPAQRWRHRPGRDAALQAEHVGESIVDVPTPYEICRRIFSSVTLESHDLFIDLGCAAGRVVLYGALVTTARFRGIELIAERAAIATEAARRLELDRVEIIEGDVLDQDFGAGTVFYAFRPFSVETEAKVLERLHAEARRRAITVVTHRLQPSLFDLTVFERTDHGALQVLRSIR